MVDYMATIFFCRKSLDIYLIVKNTKCDQC